MTESTKHRHAFECYWRLGENRSIERLHAALKADGEAPSVRTLAEWSSKYGWQERIAELERTAWNAEDEARKSELREMAERHTKEALLLQQKGAEWLSQLAADQVTVAAAIRAITEGVRLEREALGADKKIDITQVLREMAIEEGLDPDQAVRDAERILKRTRR